MTACLGIPAAQIGNPHEVPAEQDRVLPVRRDVPGYSETAFLSTWSPQSRTGVFIHVGRCPQDVDLWYAQTLAYLPDGRIAVDRSWGRSRNPGSIETGNLRLELGSVPGCWKSTFDGAAELCTPALMAQRPSGAGVARPMRWQFETSPAGPIFDLYSGRREHARVDWAKGTHTQQVMHVRGTLWVNGIEYCLDGTGGNDHSSGPRDLSNFASHHFLIGAFPGSTLHCISVFGADSKPLIHAGAEFGPGNSLRAVYLADAPPITRLDVHDALLSGRLVGIDGAGDLLRFELQHFFPLSLNLTKDNVNGVDWLGPDQLVLTEARVRMVRESDGAVGYAHLERSTLRSRVGRPPFDRAADPS